MKLKDYQQFELGVIYKVKNTNMYVQYDGKILWSRYEGLITFGNHNTVGSGQDVKVFNSAAENDVVPWSKDQESEYQKIYTGGWSFEDVIHRRRLN